MEDVRIVALAHGGEGIARPEGRPVTFVPLAAPGDLLRVVIVKEARDYRRASIAEVLEPGPGRQAAPCPEFGACGGCAWQHLTPLAQAQAVSDILATSLRRGGLRMGDAALLPPLGLVEPMAARQRVRLHLSLDPRAPRVGLLRAGSHEIHDIARCFVLEPALEDLRVRVGAALPELAAILPGTRAQLQLDLPAEHQATAALNVAQAVDDAAALGMALDALAARAPELRALVARAPARTPAGAMEARLGGERVEFRRGPLEDPTRWPAFHAPGAFLQASREGNRLLTSEVLATLRALSLPAGARVLELFAGSGNLTLPLAGEGLDVLASDADERAVRLAQRATEACDEPLRFAPRLVATAAGAHVEALARAGARFDLVVLDPPREGARELMGALASVTRRVLSISCDAATFARDAALLQRAGFELARARPLLLFPQASHFEIVALMERAP